MTTAALPWLALDIGGANIKAAHSSGEARSVAFALWKQPDELARQVEALGRSVPPTDHVALTMTGELCDCYPTRAEGVRSIVDSVRVALPKARVIVWGVDGRFHEVEEIRQNPMIAAAANWLALATVAARLVPIGPGLLIDVGSTTTDLIPLLDGRVIVRGRTDFDRLRTGELVYAGARRTPVASIAREVVFRGAPTGLAAELFASTLDVSLTLGDILDDPTNFETADGRGATSLQARDRLARMVGLDRDDFTTKDARELARALDHDLTDRLEQAARRVTSGSIVEPPGSVVIAGSGEFLARRVAARLVGPGGSIIELSEAWGPVASVAGCASALIELARDWEAHR